MTNKQFEAMVIEPLQDGDSARLQAFVDDLLQRTRLPGISVAVTVQGTTIGAASGRATTNSCFELGCIKKLLIALVVHELVDEGLLQLNSSVSSYLAELRGTNGDGVTLAHLLTHTAGNQDEDISDPDVAAEYTFDQFATSFITDPMMFTPGTVFNYGHSASALLATLIARVTGNSLHDHIRTRILEPLGIEALHEPPPSSPRCAARYGLNPHTGRLQVLSPVRFSDFWSQALGPPCITVRDLARIGGALANDRSMFSVATRQQLLTAIVKIPGQFVGRDAEDAFFAFGSGCAVFPTGTFGARSTSAGQCCAVRLDAGREIAVAVAMSCATPRIRDVAISKILNSLLPTDPPIVEDLCPPPQTDYSLEELQGRYEGAQNVVIQATPEDGCLAFRTLRSSTEPRDTQRIMFSITREAGKIAPAYLSPHLSVGFFRAPRAKEVAMMIGGNAYRKVSR